MLQLSITTTSSPRPLRNFYFSRTCRLMASGCLFILNDLLMCLPRLGQKGLSSVDLLKFVPQLLMFQPSWIYIESEGSVPSAFWMYLSRVGKRETTFPQHTNPTSTDLSLDFCSTFWLHHFGASQEPTLLPFKESQWASPLPPRIVQTRVTAKKSPARANPEITNSEARGAYKFRMHISK